MRFEVSPADYRAGVEVTAEELTMATLLDEEEHANSRAALMLAIALQRPAAR